MEDYFVDDPITAAATLIVSSLQVTQAIGDFVQTRREKKALERQAAEAAAQAQAQPQQHQPGEYVDPAQAAAEAAALEQWQEEWMKQWTAQLRRDILYVNGVMGERLMHLGVVNNAALPAARDEIRVCIAQARGEASEILPILDGEVPQAMQYAVAVGMYFCAACFPLPIYPGFGACALNDWTWDGFDSEKVSNYAPISQFNDCIALVKNSTRGHDVLVRKPEGFHLIPPIFEAYPQNRDVKKIADALSDYVTCMRKRGVPQFKVPTSPRITEVIMPWSTYVSPFALVNAVGSPELLTSWPQDPGRLFHAFTVGGFLDLQPGQIIDTGDPCAQSFFQFLQGLRGMTFRLFLYTDLDLDPLKLSRSTRKLLQQTESLAYAIIRDEGLVQLRDQERKSTFERQQAEHEAQR